MRVVIPRIRLYIALRACVKEVRLTYRSHVACEGFLLNYVSPNSVFPSSSTRCIRRFHRGLREALNDEKLVITNTRRECMLVSSTIKGSHQCLTEHRSNHPVHCSFSFRSRIISVRRSFLYVIHAAKHFAEGRNSRRPVRSVEEYVGSHLLLGIRVSRSSLPASFSV